MQTTQSYDIPLHDIKMVTFQSNPYEIFNYIFLAILFGALFFYLFYKTTRWLKLKNKKELPLTCLSQIDLKNSKKSAYELTMQGLSLRDKSTQHKEAYEKMVSKLEAYKYKKEVDEFDAETIKTIEEFRELK